MATDGRSKHYGADGRLGRQLENGVTGLQRQYVDAERPRDGGSVLPAVRVKKEVVALQASNSPLSKAPGAGAKRSGPKAWEELGLSRTEYFRRKKAGRL